MKKTVYIYLLSFIFSVSSMEGYLHNMPQESKNSFQTGKFRADQLKSMYGQAQFKEETKNIKITENNKKTLIEVYVFCYRDINKVFEKYIEINKSSDKKLMQLQEQYNNNTNPQTIQRLDEELFHTYKMQISSSSELVEKILPIPIQFGKTIINDILKGEIILESEITVCKLLIHKIQKYISLIDEMLKMIEKGDYSKQFSELDGLMKNTFAPLKDKMKTTKILCEEYEEKITNTKYIKFSSKEEESQYIECMNMKDKKNTL